MVKPVPEDSGFPDTAVLSIAKDTVIPMDLQENLKFRAVPGGTRIDITALRVACVVLPDRNSVFGTFRKQIRASDHSKRFDIFHKFANSNEFDRLDGFDCW